MTRPRYPELYQILWDLRYDNRPHGCGDTEYCDGWHGNPDPDDVAVAIATEKLVALLDYQAHIEHHKTSKREWWSLSIAHEGRSVYGEIYLTEEKALADKERVLKELRKKS